MIAVLYLFVVRVAIGLISSTREWRVGGFGVVNYPDECVNKYKIFLNIYENREFIGIIIAIICFIISTIVVFIKLKKDKLYNLIKIILVSLCIFEGVSILCSFGKTMYGYGRNSCAVPISKHVIVDNIEE